MPGLDRTVIKQIDADASLRRIAQDVRSDFITAPHFNAIFLKAGDELWERAREGLTSGKYEPSLATTIAVPKPRGFTRPGSILQPIDRIIYQALGDLVAPQVESNLDRSRVFSNILADPDPEGLMFEPEHDSWGKLQKRLSELVRRGGHFVKADVSNYFERIPQHHLINLMRASGCQSEVVNLVEELLLAFQERDSFGIIQGLFTSDLLGNFYLSDLDAYCEIHGIPSVRFVDDVYLHYRTEHAAAQGLMLLVDQLRREGLHLNEFKSGLRTADDLFREETDLDRLFGKAIKEVRAAKRKGTEIRLGYGFQAAWELLAEDEEDEGEDFDEEIGTAAVERLYESIEEYPGQADKIDRFCLPILRLASSEIAIPRAVEGLTARPHLVRLYVSYLSRFVPDSDDVVRHLEKTLASGKLITDYQRMYLLAGLMRATATGRETSNLALKLLTDPRVRKEVRAIAAIFAARRGTPQQRRAVRLAYEDETSSYVRSAILYGARHFTAADRKSCIKAWGGHSDTNALVAHAVRKLK